MKRSISLALTAGLFLSSCNVPSAGPADPQIATAAALTVQAAINDAPNETPLASPTAGGSGTLAVTSDPSQPAVASVGDVTNCRTGPGVNYERVAQIFPTDPVEIVGFFPPNYWIVSTKFGECWVSGEFTTPSGSFATVPTVTAPATPQGGEPNKVSISWNHSCNYVTNETNVTITWSDKEGESGYRVFRNNELAAELPANNSFFAETITLLAGQSVGYYVVAFNGVGETNSNTITFSC